ncbi:hypothetical protein M0638_27855 [Roseomonas sp. NAR14]|uniref:Uncharacterized protein n=1 Tax=Roseomonas acroporae TaxID=2937791 RepID=A0A9X1YFY6_9PROT|nr:hypothetical protein [Roseomonas acroporae]MCK8788168.1 hypothetical protein [Roseomonas acroporae]
MLLGDFVMFAEQQKTLADAAGKADWCFHVAEKARELAAGIGRPVDGLPKGGRDSFYDAWSHLGDGMPYMPDDPFSQRLDTLMQQAAPDIHRKERQPGETASTGAWFDVWNSRLVPALIALSLVAERAERKWSAEIKRGVSSRTALAENFSVGPGKASSGSLGKTRNRAPSSQQRKHVGIACPAAPLSSGTGNSCF